jgi:hypothetical protein
MEEQAKEAMYGWSGAWNGTPHPGQGTIPPNSSVTVSFHPLLSLFTSGKCIPNRYASVEVELSLTPAAIDFLSTTDHQATPAAAGSTFSLENLQLVYDALSLDPAVEQSFYSSILANRVLSIPVTQCIQIQQNIPTGATSLSFNVSRAFSRLTHVWLTFVGTATTTNIATSFVNPVAQDAAYVNSLGTFPNFTANTDSVNCPQIRLSIGPMNIPDPAPVSSWSEHWMMLQKVLPHTPYLDRADFMQNTFVSAFSTLRTPGDPTSAISTRAGELLRIDIKNLTGGSQASSVYVTLMAFSCVSVREAGITMLD